MKKFINQSGFTLAEVLIAAGLLGLVSVGVMQVVDRMSRGQKKLVVNQTLNDLSQTISRIMLSKEACFRTLTGKTLADSPTFSTIVNSKGNPVVQEGSVYGKGTAGAIRVTEIGLEPITPAPTSPSEPNASVVVTLETVSAVKWIWGGRSRKKKHNINVRLNGSGEVVECFGPVDDYTAAACASMGGTLNTTTGDCENLAFSASNICIGGNCTSIIPGIGNKPRICQDGYCQTKVPSGKCPNNEVVVGIKNGSLVCAPDSIGVQ